MTISGTFCRVGRQTILFADADANTRFAYESVASAAYYDVELARDGYEAVAVATSLVPDVVVLDTALAGLDGFEVTRQLRASPRTRALPILIVSSDDGLSVDEAVRRCGCNAHLVKPCSAQGLLQLIRILLIRANQADETPVSVARTAWQRAL